MRYAILNEGRIYWTWKQPDLGDADVVGSDRFWAMRLPLGSKHGSFGYLNLYRQFDSDVLRFDVNYLTTTFQPAVAEAAERIFVNARQSTLQRLAAAG